MDKGVASAVRRFPAWSLEICRLALADAGFRSLCDDFGDAEDALTRWRQIPAADGDVRTTEYATLVEELADEIAGIVLLRREAHADGT
ncbi:MAG: hypothetical protein KDK07_08435 [Bauldia sp.]|nr:hypothetical protein [Bauldia sp.]